jgi:hypothetical protein
MPETSNAAYPMAFSEMKGAEPSQQPARPLHGPRFDLPSPPRPLSRPFPDALNRLILAKDPAGILG